MNRFLISILLLFLVFSPVLGQSWETHWSEADSAYQTKDYDKVIENYLSVLSIEGPSLEVYHNLGNAFYRKGMIGNAIIYYEKALLIDHNDVASTNNIELIYNQQEDPIIAVEPFFLFQWWQDIYRILDPGKWAILALLLMGTTCFLAFLILFRSQKFSGSKYKMLATTLFVLSLASSVCGYSHFKFIYDNPFAIVIADDSVLYDGADIRSESVKDLYSGAKLMIIDRIGDWYKVASLDKEHGWIEAKNIEKIALEKG